MSTTPRPTASSKIKSEREAETDSSYNDLVFSQKTFVWIGIGVALLALGMILMAGGQMPDPNVWDESIIYSFRRITLAPIVLLSGLGVITYAILRK